MHLDREEFERGHEKAGEVVAAALGEREGAEALAWLSAEAEALLWDAGDLSFDAGYFAALAEAARRHPGNRFITRPGEIRPVEDE